MACAPGAREVAEVAQRCNLAKETRHLDLTGCCLSKIPHALYLLLACYPPRACTLADNQLKALPARFCEVFCEIESLVLSGNVLTDLPSSLSGCSRLEVLDVSNNQLQSLPAVIYQLPCIQELRLAGNAITDLDVDRLKNLTTLRKLEISENPLLDDIRHKLQDLQDVTCTFAS